MVSCCETCPMNKKGKKNWNWLHSHNQDSVVLRHCSWKTIPQENKNLSHWLNNKHNMGINTIWLYSWPHLVQLCCCLRGKRTTKKKWSFPYLVQQYSWYSLLFHMMYEHYLQICCKNFLGEISLLGLHLAEMEWSEPRHVYCIMKVQIMMFDYPRYSLKDT